jgi:four helix bundle protein
MAGFNSFEDLEIWQQSRLLTKKIYGITKNGDFARDYALRDQIRRSIISVMANIAEGFYRDGNPEFIQFLSIAKGSAGETKSHVFVAFDVGYICEKEFEDFISSLNEIINKTTALIKYLKNSNNKGFKHKQ